MPSLGSIHFIFIQLKRSLTGEEATAVRKHAEDTLFVRFADYYKAWSEKAEMNAMWTAANPIHIKVEKNGLNLTINMLPILEEISGKHDSKQLDFFYNFPPLC